MAASPGYLKRLQDSIVWPFSIKIYWFGRCSNSKWLTTGGQTNMNSALTSLIINKLPSANCCSLVVVLFWLYSEKISEWKPQEISSVRKTQTSLSGTYHQATVKFTELKFEHELKPLTCICMTLSVALRPHDWLIGRCHVKAGKKVFLIKCCVSVCASTCIQMWTSVPSPQVQYVSLSTCCMHMTVHVTSKWDCPGWESSKIVLEAVGK